MVAVEFEVDLSKTQRWKESLDLPKTSVDLPKPEGSDPPKPALPKNSPLYYKELRDTHGKKCILMLEYRLEFDSEEDEKGIEFAQRRRLLFAPCSLVDQQGSCLPVEQLDNIAIAKKHNDIYLD